MPYSGGGVFTLTPGYTATTGQTILPSQHNPPLEDIAASLSMAFIRDGRAAATGNFAMGGNRVTGAADAVDPQDLVTKARQPWERIGNVVTAPAGTTNIAVTNLSGFSFVKLAMSFDPVGVTSGFSLLFSYDNGATYQTGATTYRYHGFFEKNGTISPVGDVSASSFPLGSASVGNSPFACAIDIFSASLPTTSTVFVKSHYIDTTPGLRYENLNGFLLKSAPITAIKIQANNGSFSGSLNVEGAKA